MNKPAFNDLPWSVQERLWRDMDDLDYDSYDSSREECLADIRNGYANSRNEEMMKRYYKNKSADDILVYCSNRRLDIIIELRELNKLMGLFDE